MIGKNKAANYNTRCLISHPPKQRNSEPSFFRCAKCGNLCIVYNDTPSEEPKRCCGNHMERLEASEPDESVHKVQYTVFGGMDHNAIQIQIDQGMQPAEEGHQIEWIYLRTFEGGQLKFLNQGERTRVVFAMAGEDAYAFCNRDVCRMGWEHCQFQCKRGWVIYLYCSKHGLIKRKL